MKPQSARLLTPLFASHGAPGLLFPFTPVARPNPMNFPFASSSHAVNIRPGRQAGGRESVGSGRL